MSFKRDLLISLAIGAMISAVLLGIESRTDYAYLSWEEPGVLAALLYLGVAGGPAFAGIAICWLVNAVAYGAPALAVVSVVGMLKNMATR